MALAAGIVDDAVAWCLLAVVLASLNSTPSVAILAVGGGLLYTLGMVFVGRPFFRFFTRWTERDRGVTPATMLVLVMILMASAWFTDEIGIYALFGSSVSMRESSAPRSSPSWC